ncbi:MAG TPA: hypothetical protein V6C84_16265 [Coleofasciculaceae cyanobacterium]|jgi:hypothetical protein
MSDALERLKQRNRPTVPNRDASIAPIVLDAQISRYPEVQISTLQESHQVLQTKQTTMRLEQGLIDRLQDLCRDNSISREVLIEAMFEYCEAHSEALAAVLLEAKEKNEQRQQVANLKRAKSMMQRFGQTN